MTDVITSYLAPAANEQYDSTVFAYIGSALQTGFITDVSLALGISATAIAGSMAEENQAYQPQEPVPRSRRGETPPHPRHAGVGRDPPRHAHRAGIPAVPGHQGVPGSRAGTLARLRRGQSRAARLGQLPRYTI